MIDNPCLTDNLVADYTQSRCYDNTLRGYTISGDSSGGAGTNGFKKVGNYFQYYYTWSTTSYSQLVTMLPNGSLSGDAVATLATTPPAYIGIVKNGNSFAFYCSTQYTGNFITKYSNGVSGITNVDSCVWGTGFGIDGDLSGFQYFYYTDSVVNRTNWAKVQWQPYYNNADGSCPSLTPYLDSSKSMCYKGF